MRKRYVIVFHYGGDIGNIVQLYQSKAERKKAIEAGAINRAGYEVDFLYATLGTRYYAD